METQDNSHWSKTGFLIAIGVVYGDIGTSPLYVMKAIVEGQGGLTGITEEFIIGTVSLIIWTLTLLTTIKYVLIALNADNHGEGGIFSLFTLVRKMSKWLIIPAMIGGAALLADGALTPAVTVTSAIEGLRGVPQFVEIFGTDQNVIIVITLIILAFLFGIQHLGTNRVGKLFGPIMLGWFFLIGISGLFHLMSNLTILRAINPMYAIQLLLSPANKEGIFILGSIFLATTGAEALYSDLGHVGKQNIYISWPFVKISLLLCYFGQAAWLLGAREEQIATPGPLNPFFELFPENITVIAVIFATLAAIIASQALISGSFTLVSEAVRLKLLPRVKILYPGYSMGQMYIPAVNHILWITTSAIVLYFQTSHRMEAAYGLAITITMLMTTMLLFYYLIQRKMKKTLAFMIATFFALIEFMFFISSIVKFLHGGYVAVGISLAIIFVMFIWHQGNKITERYRQTQTLDLSDYKEQLKNLRDDDTIDLYQTNVVFLTNSLENTLVERSILYSILDKHPKRAKVYWLVNVEVTDEPYTNEYEIDMMNTDYIVRVKLYLGFRMSQDVPRYLRRIVRNLMDSGRLAKQQQKYTTTPGRDVGYFRFIIIEEKLVNARRMNKFERFIISMKLNIKKMTTSPVRWFGLQFSEVKVETVPFLLSDVGELGIVERE